MYTSSKHPKEALLSMPTACTTADAAAHTLEVEVGVGIAADTFVALGLDDLQEVAGNEVVEAERES
jgi:hypothetical protein